MSSKFPVNLEGPKLYSQRFFHDFAVPAMLNQIADIFLSSNYFAHLSSQERSTYVEFIREIAKYLEKPDQV